MTVIEQIVHYISIALSLVGIAAVVVGVAEALIRYVGLHLFRTDDGTFAEKAPQVRARLGEHLALGLDVFIAADIVNSALAPTWEKVGLLAAIVAIRVVLSWILLREIEQARAESAGGRKD
ncbi:MAG: hypothetical protein RL477_2169 [Pseudomonadota bacterium]